MRRAFSCLYIFQNGNNLLREPASVEGLSKVAGQLTSDLYLHLADAGTGSTEA
jgi:hypothetical protein